MGYLMFIFLFLVSLIFYIFFTRTSSKSKQPKLPPSPFGLPVVGHLHLLATSVPHRALYNLSLKHGPVFRLWLGSVPCVVASSPEAAKEFLKTYEGSNLDRPYNLTTSYLTYGLKDFMFAPYGSYWKLLKKLVMSELLNGSMLNMLSAVRDDEISHLMRRLSAKAKAGEAVDVEVELVKLTNNVISRMVMSERCSEDENEAGEMRRLVSEISEVSGRFNLADYIWFCKSLDLQGFGRRLEDIRSRFDALAERIISKHEEQRMCRKEKSEAHDLLDVLLDMSEDESMEMRLDRENIKAFVENLFVAGTDTTALTMTWALAELINHPDIMKKAVAEIEQVIGEDRVLKESDIPKLPYLQAIVKETLRLHPAGPMIPRRSTEDCTVMGYHIPAGTSVFVNVWAIGRDPKHWDDPLEFRPERFVESQLDARGQHFQLLPFGTGRRMCPGTSLALLVAQVTLGAMIQRFEWKAGNQGNLTSVDMEEGPGITLPRVSPLVCVPVSRLA